MKNSSSEFVILDDSSSDYITFYNKRNHKIESVNLLLAIEEYKKEIKDFSKEIELTPENIWLYYRRGEVKYKLKDFLGAIQDYTMAIKIKPNFPEAYYKRGLTKYSLNKYQGAIEDYSKAIEMKPNFAMAFFGRGNAKFQLNNDVDPCEDWKKALKLGINNETNISIMIANCNITD